MQGNRRTASLVMRSPFIVVSLLEQSSMQQSMFCPMSYKFSSRSLLSPHCLLLVSRDGECVSGPPIHHPQPVNKRHETSTFSSRLHEVVKGCPSLQFGGFCCLMRKKRFPLVLLLLLTHSITQLWTQSGFHAEIAEAVHCLSLLSRFIRPALAGNGTLRQRCTCCNKGQCHGAMSPHS